MPSSNANSGRDFTRPLHYPNAGQNDLLRYWLEHPETHPVASQIQRYVQRAGNKQGEPILKDLKKAAEYLQRWIEFEEEKEANRNA